MAVRVTRARRTKRLANALPPTNGYFTSMVPVGQFNSLPDDATAASMVTRSTWEPRPENQTPNNTVAPSDVFSFSNGYSGMTNNAAVFGRVTGNYTGTTDEIVQWAAAKWGLQDNVIRAQLVRETNWYQSHKDGSGNPIDGEGYGDFASCTPGAPTPSGYGTSGPSSYGITQIKWCAHRDAGDSYAWGPWPWSETSTAYNLDFYGAVMRGCWEGWDTWLGGSYTSGDLWGCVGRWFAGAWYTTDANTYITNVQNALSAKVWLTWPG